MTRSARRVKIFLPVFVTAFFIIFAGRAHAAVGMGCVEYSAVNPDGSAAGFRSPVFYDEDSLATGNFSGFVTIFPAAIDYREKTGPDVSKFLYGQMALELAARNFLVWVVDYQDEYSNAHIYPVLDRSGAAARSLVLRTAETLTPIFERRLHAAAEALQNSAYNVCARKLPHYISGAGLGAGIAFLGTAVFPSEWEIASMHLTSAFAEPIKYTPKLLERVDRVSRGISFMHSPDDSAAPLSAVRDLAEILKGRNIDAGISAFNPPLSSLADEESVHSLYITECVLQSGNAPSPMAREIIESARGEGEIPSAAGSEIERVSEDIPLDRGSGSFVGLRMDLKYRDIIDILPGLVAPGEGRWPSVSGKAWSGGRYNIDFDVSGTVFTPDPREKERVNIRIPLSGRLYQKIFGTEIAYEGFSGNLEADITSEITPEWEASLRLSRLKFSMDRLSDAAEDLISLLDSVGVDFYEEANNWLDSRVPELNDAARFPLRETVSEGWKKLQQPARISIEDHHDMFLNVTPDFLAIDPPRFSPEKMSVSMAIKADIELSTLPRDTGAVKALPAARRVPEGAGGDIILRVPLVVRFKELNELFAAALARKISHRDGNDRLSFILFVPEVSLRGGADGTLVLNCLAKVEFFKLLTFKKVVFSLPVRPEYDVKNQLLYLNLRLDDKAGKDLEKQLSRFIDEDTAKIVRDLILLLAGDRKIVYNTALLTGKLDERVDEEIRKYSEGLLILGDTYAAVSGIEGLTVDDEGIRLKSFFRGRGVSVDAMGFLMLMAAEKNPRFRDAKGRTLLSRAILDNRTALIEELIKRGVDPSVADFEGKMAADFARERGRNDIAEIIENAYPNKLPPTADPGR
jgi:hypothetical protein